MLIERENGAGGVALGISAGNRAGPAPLRRWRVRVACVVLNGTAGAFVGVRFFLRSQPFLRAGSPSGKHPVGT